jgi:hypothetical protein
MPFELFRLRLVQLTKKLLDLLERDPRYKFNFDGQTITIEDYLQIHPEDKPRIEKFVKSRRLHIGPFYCLPDHFIVTGETIIRNVMIGVKQAKALGYCQMEGALSDIFGHPSQTPQIMAGLGVKSVVVARGWTKEQLEKGLVQRWLAPDGKTSILLYLMAAGGYANMYFFGIEHIDPATFPTPPPDGDAWSADIAEKQLKEVMAQYLKVGGTGQLFIGNGVDHQEAQPQTPEIIALLNKRKFGIKLVHSTYEDMMNTVRNEKRHWPTIEGALGECSLNATLTSRVYLKQDYASIAGRTEMLTEPLLACADVFGEGHRIFREYGHNSYTLNPGQNWAAFQYYPAGQMKYLWKLLLQNSPHDDICGCSVDATHVDMENRFKRAREITEYLRNDALIVMAGRATENLPDSKHPALVAFNPHPFAVQDRLTARVFLESVATAKHIEIVDVHGKPVPFVVDSAEVTDFHPWDGNDWQKAPVKGLSARISILPELKPCAFAVFSIRTGASADRMNSVLKPLVKMSGKNAVFENALQKITIRPDGTFDVLDKETKKLCTGMGLLEDIEDVGDSYTSKRFDPPSRPVTSKGVKGKLRIVKHDAFTTVVEVSMKLALPCSATPDKKGRSPQTVACPITIRYEIPHYRKGGRLTVIFDNKAKDHELYMMFAPGIKADAFDYDTKFDWRSYKVGEPVPRIDSCAMVSAGKNAFGLVTDCPTLLQSRRDANDAAVLGVSLVRCVGIVAGVVPNEIWRADEAQCIRTITRTLEWTTGTPADVRTSCLQQRRTITAPAQILPITPWVKNRYLERKFTKLPVPVGPLIDIKGRDVYLSCWKKSEDATGWAVRVYSLSSKPGECKIRPAVPVKKAYICNLHEEPQDNLRPGKNGWFSFAIGPREIKTLLFRLDRKVLAKHLKIRPIPPH